MMIAAVVQWKTMKQFFFPIAIAFLVILTFAQESHSSSQHKPEQDPVTLLPKNYQVQFENAWVRVVRVHYDAKSKLPEHEHPYGTTVYLYFNASDGVVFQHDDGSAPVPRPPVLPGAIRSYIAPLEHHSVTNNASTPSDFIRILLKTEIFDRLARPNVRMSPGVMDFDHPSMHIGRVDVPPGATVNLDATKFPKFRIAWLPSKTEWKITAKDGYRFLDKGTIEEFKNTGDAPMQLVTIELKTPIAKNR